MPAITLPDGSELQFEAPASVQDVAARIGKRLARDALAGKVDGELKDLSHVVDQDAQVTILTTASEAGLQVMRHTAAHVMAEAICELFPGTKLAYGPVVKDGFYYDFAPPQPISDDDLPRIEKKMKEIARRNAPLVRQELSRAAALEKYRDDKFKTDNIERADGDVISFYVQGEFEDLCRGPHVPATGRIGHFKVMSVAGAYWHGDAAQDQLTRVYGTAWSTKNELAAYLRRLEEAKKRDHRKLGRDLDIYSTHESIGPGLILWHANGGMLRHLVETFWKEEHLKRGYDILYTPHIASEEIYRQSGHLENYSEMMYAPMDIDGQPYRVKPMNCPGHIMIYNSTRRSYRELPLRWCELGTVYRYEPSGTLHGMLRVRGFTQDDSHIFCTPEQVRDEVNAVLDLTEHMLTTFGYTYKVFLATRPEKSLGTDAQWEMATKALTEVLENRHLPFEVDAGGGVFYGPKIDFKLVDALGREWQGPTTQLDFNLTERFNIEYIGADNARHPTVMIHRTVLGSMERFIGGLIEHYAGDFPLWLAPEQVRVLTITDSHIAYGEKVLAILKEKGLRAALDRRGSKIGAKIREGELAKIPYLAIVGDQEIDAGSVSVRRRLAGNLGPMQLGDFLARLVAEVEDKKLPPAGKGEE